MGKDRFDVKKIYIEQKIFEAGIMMSGFVVELLETFPEMKCAIEVQVSYNDYEKGYVIADAESVFFDSETRLINIGFRDIEAPVLWDDLDFSARDIILNEIHHRYKSDLIYKNLTSSDPREGDWH
ncbi:MAG: hypothetical protein WDA74_07670 [Spirochaetota bacterium]